ncbi:MAG: DUF3102 domain-containing protein [Oscillospiraceae bacterium]|nr:DUF3102 domain-containing protein [Oscillospiraceae bacterium]
MSEIITARDIEIVTGEIKYVQRRAARQLLSDLIEIGRLLVEAKSMVPYGEWGKYLQERVEYSTSQANNLMRLYNEYGDNQESFFSTLQNSKQFGNLTYTQALALIALPPEDRAEFVEKHDMENMSTRDVERAVREELEEVRCGKEAAEKRVTDLEEELREAKRQEHAQQEAAQLARDAQLELTEELEKARKLAGRKEKETEKAQRQLEEAQKNEKRVREQLEQLQANPKIPAAMMQQIRLEAEQEAARKATVDLRKQLDTVVAEKAAAEDKSKELEAKLAAMEKNTKLSDPDIAKFLTLCEQLQEDHNRIKGLYTKTKLTDETKAGSMKKAALALIEELRKGWA